MILSIRLSFLHFLRSANVSHLVSKYRDDNKEKIGKPVTILAAFNCIFSSLSASVCLHPSHSSLAYSSRGRIYVQ